MQHEFLNLLQGGVAEVGSARSGPSSGSLGDAGQVRARVLSATPAPDHAEPTDERVQTRRVVVSRPIETLQEVSAERQAPSGYATMKLLEPIGCLPARRQPWLCSSCSLRLT